MTITNSVVGAVHLPSPGSSTMVSLIVPYWSNRAWVSSIIISVNYWSIRKSICVLSVYCVLVGVLVLGVSLRVLLCFASKTVSSRAIEIRCACLLV